MGALTPFLQGEFAKHLPPGWACRPEVALLSGDVASLLGYNPRADVVLTDPTGRGRVWIEFEVSRADPVANHAKFATAHLVSPQGPADVFVAMVSPHIDRGRRNLASAAVRLMRRVGMRAFQTTLLPLASPADVKRLNHSSAGELAAAGLDVASEVGRALAVCTPVGAWGRLDVHLVGDLLDVATNIRGWNADVSSDAGREAWGRRATTYFAHDPASGLFAPAKFCAYTPVHSAADWPRMTAEAYAALNDGTHVMDGQKAWRHLSRELGMRMSALEEAGPVKAKFVAWHAGVASVVPTRGEVRLLVPPAWYRG